MLTAAGKVHAVFPEAATTSAGSKDRAAESQKGPGKSQFWHAQGDRLTYWSDSGHGRMEDKVHAYSVEGSMVADTMDFFFAPAGNSDPDVERRTGRPLGRGKTPGVASNSFAPRHLAT